MKSNKETTALSLGEMKKTCERTRMLISNNFHTLRKLNFNLDSGKNNKNTSIKSLLMKHVKYTSIILESNIKESELEYLFNDDEISTLNRYIESTSDIVSRSLDLSSNLLDALESVSYGELISNEASNLIQKHDDFSIPYIYADMDGTTKIAIKVLPLKFLDSSSKKAIPIIRELTLINTSKKLESQKDPTKEIYDINNILKDAEKNLKEIRMASADIININKKASSELDQLDNKSNKAEIIFKDINKKLETANAIIDSINDNMIKIESNRVKSELLSAEVKKDRDLIQNEIKSTSNSIKKIDDATTNANTASEKLNNLHQRAEDILKRSEDILTHTGSSALGGNFNAQYETAKKFIYMWPVFGLISLGTAIWICMNAISSHSSDGETSILIARIAISPIALIGVWFSGNQYIKQKQIIEDYAYKKTIALSLISFKNEIKNAETNHERDYILDALKELHKSPLDSLERKNIKEEVEVIERMRVDILKSAIENLSINTSNEKNDKKSNQTKNGNLGK